MLRLFEFAVILQPKEDQHGTTIEKGEVVVEPETILCEDDSQAQLIAGRSIPAEYMDRIERLTLVVRPF